MTATTHVDLLGHPAFKGVSTAGQLILKTAAEKVEFKTGQALSVANAIPNRVLLITSGRARIIGNQNGKVHTLALLGESSIIGLASILRTEGCEEVSASTAVETFAIPDSTILELWKSEESFRSWCNQTLFPAELAAILEKISEKVKENPIKQKISSKSVGYAKLTIYSNNINSDDHKDFDIYICSSNNNKVIGSLFIQEDPPEPRGPFPVRLICLSKQLVAELKEGKRFIQTEKREVNMSSIESEKQVNPLSEIHPTSLDLGRMLLRTESL